MEEFAQIFAHRLRGGIFAFARPPYLPKAGFGPMLQGRERQMSHTAPERRTMRRFDMRLPAAVNGAEAGMVGLLTETQNVSARGVFFYLDQPLPEGSQLEMVLTFPPHITLTDAVRVRFRARVVRVETPLPSSRVGIAAIIEDYEFLRSTDEQAVE
jgi:PilZ domain-containing protein